jgi:hypothetical protein
MASAAAVAITSVAAPSGRTAINVFFSWQSDVPTMRNRAKDAVKKALQDLNTGPLAARYEFVLRQATDGAVGAADIADNLFTLISHCDIFIADATIVNSSAPGMQADPGDGAVAAGGGAAGGAAAVAGTAEAMAAPGAADMAATTQIPTAMAIPRDAGEGSSRLTPNPNVMLELGYAAGTMGWDCIIIILDGVRGKPEYLPFDVRGRRMVVADTTWPAAKVVKHLADAVVAHVTTALQHAVRPLVDLFNELDENILPALAAILGPVGPGRVVTITVFIESHDAKRVYRVLRRFQDRVVMRHMMPTEGRARFGNNASSRIITGQQYYMDIRDDVVAALANFA